jgi:thymidylate synthase (FAD)
MTQIKATYIDHMGSDLSVVNAARVSFGKKSGWDYDACEIMHLADRDTKLIKYLAEHKHISPFGHCFLSLHVKAPIFVARQLVKHKFLRINEISRRYVDNEPEFYVPEVWRGRSADKKQGSEGMVDLKTIPAFDCERIENGSIEEVLEENLFDLLRSYRKMIRKGVAPEMARMILPQSTMTEWYWSGSLDAFADMCRLRCADDAQYESRLVADQISKIITPLFPISWAALTEEQT